MGSKHGLCKFVCAAVRGAVLALVSGAMACATPPTQAVGLQVEPANASLFVDREELAPVPPELVLASDRPHVLFFRAEGYRPQQVVLEPRMQEGRYVLEPAFVHVRLAPLVPTESAVAIEGDD